MIRPYVGLVALCAVVATPPTTALAGRNTPTVNATLVADGEALQLHIEATNQSGQPLWHVYPVLRIMGQDVELAATEELKPGATVEWDNRIPVSSLAAEGGQVLPLWICYEDPGRYASSVPLAVGVEGGPPSGHPAVKAALDVRAAPGFADIDLHVQNLAAQAVVGTVDLMLPAELTLEPASMDLQLPPAAVASATYRVRTAGALPGARYRVYALVHLDGTNGTRTELLSSDLTVGPLPADEGGIRLQLGVIVAFVVSLFFVGASLELRSAGTA